jgi:two-component system OmpR family sensor kinase
LGTLVLEVSDDGHGMADADRARLFARGESASGDRLRGLGLVSVLAILRRYDGRLFVATEEGVGSTFVVSLPLGFRRGAASPD